MEEENKKSRLRKTFSIRNLFLGIFVLAFLHMYLQMQSLLGNFSFLEGRDSSLITEIGDIRESYDKMGDSMNEVRKYLGMPAFEFETEEVVPLLDGEGLPREENDDDIQLAMFEYIDFLNQSAEITEAITANVNLVDQLTLSEVLEEYYISEPEELDNKYVVVFENEEALTLVKYYVDLDDGTLYMKSADEVTEIEVDNIGELEAEVKDFLDENAEVLVEKVKKFEQVQGELEVEIARIETEEVLLELNATIDDQPFIEGNEYIYSVRNYTEDVIGEIEVLTDTAEIWLKDTRNANYDVQATDISKSLIPWLEKLDTKTVIESKVEVALKKVQATVGDKGFEIVMNENGLNIYEEPREDDERYYFDIYDINDVHISSIVVEKMTGVINIVDPDGTNSENLLFFDPEFKKKTLEIPEDVPDYGDEVLSDDGTFNILIAGKHGNLVDTMILAHLDEAKGTVRMVSVPRDLHYNGRKINSFPFYYGMPELKTVLTNMTGYEVDKYILIDMYAFIDVIDLIGGIDISLERPVVDPTYRTVDDGVVGTLSYQPGDYHLGGKEALRLARTRHTSSDFARAERQQMIIESIQSKAQNFGFGDADTLYEIAKTVLDKTETDVTLEEAISYYFKYQNYSVESNAVMSSGNVLFSPPYITMANCQSNIAAAEAAGEAKPACENENHAYILIPRNEDWNLIKWFFRQNFEESV
jgi:polyisoprenyl-teichoic acid--peptidoglycan teichoic acid transferase